MKGRIGLPLFLFLGVSLLFSAAAPPAGQSLLYVDVSEQGLGKTYLAVRSLETSDAVRITPAMFQIVGPIVDEKNGMIGFTHLTRMMKTEIYLLRPDGKGPVKWIDGSSLDDFAPDGKSLLITSSGMAPALSIYDLAARTSRKISGSLLVPPPAGRRFRTGWLSLP
jgi:hypothetical protein